MITNRRRRWRQPKEMELVGKLKLLGERILVRYSKTEEKVGHFYIPEKSREQVTKNTAWRAKIIEFGDDFTSEGLYTELNKGDIVHVDPIAIECPSFKENGERYIIIMKEDLLGVEEKHERK